MNYYDVFKLVLRFSRVSNHLSGIKPSKSAKIRTRVRRRSNEFLIMFISSLRPVGIPENLYVIQHVPLYDMNEFPAVCGGTYVFSPWLTSVPDVGTGDRSFF